MSNFSKYGFGQHLNASFPSQIIVDVTEKCNLECIHCPHKDFVKSRFYQGQHLDLELHDKLINEVNKAGRGICQYLRYTAQGDPLLHPKFIEMIEYANVIPDTLINITTNGKALTEQSAESLLMAGVDVFDFSLDAATPKTYAAIRKKGDLNITKNNILKLMALIRNNNYKTKVVVSFVEQPLNSMEIADFKKYWENAGADFVVIRRMHSCAGAKSDKALEMINRNPTRKPCLYPWERIVLSPTGQLGFCPADWQYQSKIADFRNTTIKQAWQNQQMQKLRLAHIDNDFSKHEFCGQCPDWSAMRWPHEGRAYSNMMSEFKNSKN